MPPEPADFGHLLPDLDPAWLSVPVGVGAAAAVLAYAPLTADAATMLAITVFCVSLWIGSPVGPWFTGLICIGLIGVAFSTDLALTGFRSAATWLIVLGILLGEATRQSGLAGRVESRVLHRLAESGRTDAAGIYRYMLVSLSTAAAGLIVLVPSSLVRVLILGPILISVGDVFQSRRPRVGLFLGPLFVTYYAGTGILTGALPNIIITGLVEANANTSFGWVEWATWLAPVMGLGRGTVVTVVAYVLYRPREPSTVETDVAASGETAAPADARRMLGFLLVGVAVWATDTVHGLHPLYGALVVVLLAFAPRIGVVGPDAVADADFSIVFFLGAIFAVAAGLREMGFTELAARTILSYLPADASLVLVLVFVVIATLPLMFLMEGLAVASVLTPVLVSFAVNAGVPLLPVAMTEAVVLNTYFFPYQSAVLVAMLGLGMTDAREIIRMATVCSLATLGVLLPIQIAIFSVAF